MDEFSEIVVSEEYYVIQRIHQEVGVAIDANNVEMINDILINKKYSPLEQNEKEQQVFMAVEISFKHEAIGEDILKFLIFDYNISDDNSIKIISANTTEYIKSLFEIRNLNSDLIAELSLNKEKNKKLKA